MRDLDRRQQRSRLDKTGYMAAGLLVIVLGAVAAYFVLMPSLLPN